MLIGGKQLGKKVVMGENPGDSKPALCIAEDGPAEAFEQHGGKLYLVMFWFISEKTCTRGSKINILTA